MKRVSIALLCFVGLTAGLAGCSPSEPKPDLNAPSGTGSAAESKESAALSIPAVSEADAAKAQKMAKEAEVVMNDPKLPAKEKYPKALSMFNDALKVDPQNKLALDSKGMIEGIYESMGKPIPGTN